MYRLTITRETYSRTASGKGWKARPDEVETETLAWYAHDANGGPSGEDKYRKITDADTLRFFRRLGGSEYAERSHTPVGYIVTRLVSTNPDRTVRIIRKFRISRED